MAIQPNAAAMNWAIERSGLDRDSLIKKWPKLEQWIDGSHSPTIKQIRDFADTVHINVSALFSDALPDRGLQIADFRTVDDHGTAYPTPELYDTINLMMRRQQWMRDYFSHENYSAVDYVGLFSNKPMNYKTAEYLAEYLHELLGLADNWAEGYKTVNDAFKALKSSIERVGISVVVNGVVNDNTHRVLKVDEFRGFVLSDTIAPLIFINGRDAKTAQMFTLVHELAHLAYSQTGVSNPSDELDGKDSDMEKFCNRTAADFLVPTALLLQKWEHASLGVYERTERIARQLKVNFVVVARKAKDIDLITRQTFFEIYNKYQSNVPLQFKGKGGGDYYLTKQYKLGSVFSDAVWAAVNTGFISYRDAYDLTGMGSDSFRKYFMEV